MAYIDPNQQPVQEPQLTQAPTNYGGVLGGFGNRLQGLLQSEGWARMLEGAANSDNTWQGLAQAGAGYVRGNRAQMQQDQNDAEKEQRRAALNNWLRQRSGLSPQDQQLMQANPEIGGMYAAEVLKPQEYKPPTSTDISNFQFDQSQGFKGSFHDWMNQSKQQPANPNQQFDNVSGLRKEVQNLPSYKNYAQIVPIYNSMLESAPVSTKASDLNLVYGLGKIMDPTSVVREGEQTMVRNTAAWPDYLKGAYSQLQGGAALDPATRAAILSEAYGRAASYHDAFNNDIAQYKGIVDRYGINQADVIPTIADVQPYQPPGSEPPAGGASSVNDPLGIR